MNRKLFLHLFLSSALLTVIACKSKESKTTSNGDPKEVVTRFYKYVALHNVAGIRSVSTSGSRQAIDMMSLAFAQADAEEKPDETDALEALKNIVLAEPQVNGDRATVAVEDTVKKSRAVVSLVKNGSEWQVDLTKSQR